MTRRRATIFANLKRVASVMVETFGRNCEVAIHDFDLLPNSLVHIEGSVTQRQPGAPVTDLVLRALRSGIDPLRDIANYRTVTQEGRILKSSTTFIYGENDHLLGAFCVNFDITDHMNALGVLEEFTQIADSNGRPRKETFAASLDETLASLMETSIRKLGKQPATMSREEKIQLVRNLETQGTFMIRGAVAHVAQTMGVSKFTVYNYLKEVRSRQTAGQARKKGASADGHLSETGIPNGPEP